MAYKFTAIPGVGAGRTTPAAPGSYPFQAITDIGIKRAPYVNFNQFPIAPGSSASSTYKAPTGAAAEPWWHTGLNMLSAPGKIVTDQIANWTDGTFNWKQDIPLINQTAMLGKGLERQWDNWNDGSLTFDDIPVLSSLANMGREGKGFSQTLSNLGVTNDKGLFWGGLAGDIALDPLTWLTFGGTSAIKVGAKAGATTASEIAADYGIKFTGSAKKALRTLPDSIAARVSDDLLDAGSSFRVAEKQADYAADLVKQRIQDSMKAGRSKAQNALLSIDIPFTKTTYQIGKKPAALTKASPPIRAQGAAAIENLMTRYGIDPVTTGSELVQKGLGKTNLEEVTFQEFNWLKNELKNFSEKAAKAQNANPFSGAAPGTVRGTNFGTKAVNTGKVAEAANPVDAFQFSSRFTPEMGGVSPFGAKIADAFRYMNPRQVGTLAGSGSLVNNGGNLLQDTFNKIRNNLGNRLPQRTKDIMKQADEFTPAEKDALNYALEGEFPKGFDMDSFDATKVYRMAETLKGEFAEMATAEGFAGVLPKTLTNYAPHVINQSDDKVADILQKYADDPELASLAKVSASNSFGKSRTSFKSFAQLDNYLADLGQKITQETDPARIAQMQAKLDDVSGIFERDPFKAFQKRLYKSYRVRELGDMYKVMKDDGLLLEPDIASYDRSLYTRLDAADAKRMNVPVGTVMHKDMHKALIEADKLFNSEGMSKLMDTASSVNNIWKGLTTTIRPAHHFNNLIGNIFNNSLAGVGVADYSRATKMLNRISRGKPKQEDLDLMEKAMSAGVFGQSHADEYRRIFGNTPAKGIRKMEQVVQNNPITNFMRKWMGDTIDNWSRLAHFSSVLDKTGSEKLAADSVRKFLFNYGEQTSTDRFIRTFAMPFWTWTKNNIPLQVEQLAKQPRYYQTYLRLQDASYEAQGLSKEDAPEFAQNDYFATPWHLLNKIPGVEGLGIVPEGPTLRNPRAPMSDLNNFNSPQELFKFLASSSPPFARIPVEQGMQRQIFTGKPITNQWEYGLQQAPILNDFYKMFSGQSSILDILTGKELDIN